MKKNGKTKKIEERMKFRFVKSKNILLSEFKWKRRSDKESERLKELFESFLMP